MGKKSQKHQGNEKKREDLDSFLEKNKRPILVGILFLHLIFALLLFDPKLYTGGDNATYIILAKSILSGQGFRDLHKPGSPPHTLVPFGYPLLLSPLLLISGENYLPLKLLSLLLSLGVLYLFYRLLERRYPLPFVFGLVLLLAMHPLLLEYTRWILTEIPFLFFSMAALLYFHRGDQYGAKKAAFLLPGSFFVVLPYFIRSIGISFVIATLVYLLAKRNLRGFILVLLFSSAMIFSWWFRTRSVGGEPAGYVSQFILKNPYDIHSGRVTVLELFSRVRENFEIYVTRGIPEILFPSVSFGNFSKGHLWAFSLALLGLVLYGLARDVERGLEIHHLYVFSYGGILLLWPSVWSTTRFLMPIFPFLLLFALWGAASTAEKLFRWKGTLLGSMILLILLFPSIALSTLPMIPLSIRMKMSYLRGDRFAGYSSDWIRYFETAEWVKKNTPHDSVILCRKPELFFLFSDRQSLVYPMTFNRKEIYSFIEEKEVDYIVVDSFLWTGTTPRYLIPVLQEHSAEFEAVFVSNDPKTYVLRVLKDSP